MNTSFTEFLKFILPVFLSGFCLQAQTVPEFNDINTKWQKGLVSNVQYVTYADSVLTDFVFIVGASMNNDSLVDMLSIYKKIVTSDKQFVKQRGLYYYYLASNANNQNLGGMMIYYSEKYRTEIGRNSYRATIPLSFLVNHYSSKKQYDNILKLYDDEKNYLKQQRDSILTGPSRDARYKTLMGIYDLIADAAYNNNRMDIAQTVLNANLEMHSKLSKEENADEFTLAISNLYITLNKVNISLLKNQSDSLDNLLTKSINEIEKFRKDYSYEADLYSGYAKEALIKYYKKTNQPEALLRVFQTFEFAFPAFQIYKSKEKGLAYLSLGNHKTASKMLLETVNLQEIQLLSMANEINSLLYSYIDSERNRENLVIAQRDKRIRMILIISIAGASIIIIGLLFYLLTSQRRQLRLLNKTTEIQINEATQRTSKEERQKIGQDLHDGLSGSMAGILYHLEDIKTKTNGSELDNEVTSLYDKLQLVYKELREKSHVNFNALYDSKEDSLGESVQKIVNSALKNNTKREIEIDKKTAVMLDTSTRIEILRIVQEALANIVKHAKKVTEVFVYLYENEGSVYLEIGNNGVISASKNSDGIGIRSIKSRVSALGGESKIEYEGIGFKLEIKLPKPIHL